MVEEIPAPFSLLLHHSRCKASEQAAADAMAAATRRLSGGGAETERVRGVTEICGALPQLGLGSGLGAQP